MTMMTWIWGVVAVTTMPLIWRVGAVAAAGPVAALVPGRAAPAAGAGATTASRRAELASASLVPSDPVLVPGRAAPAAGAAVSDEASAVRAVPGAARSAGADPGAVLGAESASGVSRRAEPVSASPVLSDPAAVLAGAAAAAASTTSGCKVENPFFIYY